MVAGIYCRLKKPNQFVAGCGDGEDPAGVPVPAGVADAVVVGLGISAMRMLFSRLRCLVTKASMIWAPSLAEFEPQSPFCQSTATTISGLRRGAMPTNHALGTVWWPPPLRARASWLMTWAVPVLPAKSMPSRCEAPAVLNGPSVVACAIPSVMICQFSGVSGIVASPEPGKVSWIAESSSCGHLVREDDMRTAKDATGGDAAESTGQLQRRGGDGSLTDADRDDLAGVPLLVEVLHLPCGRGHGSGDLVRQVDAGLLREAERGGVAGDGVDAELVREGVEVGVARPRNGVVDVDHAVMLVARKEVAVERRLRRCT